MCILFTLLIHSNTNTQQQQKNDRRKTWIGLISVVEMIFCESLSNFIYGNNPTKTLINVMCFYSHFSQVLLNGGFVMDALDCKVDMFTIGHIFPLSKAMLIREPM